MVWPNAENETVEAESGTTKPLTKGRRMYVSEKLSCPETSSENGFVNLRSLGQASLKKSTVRRPRISLDNEGNVASTRCDCEAGADGRCCHVAALLFMADDLALGRQPVMQEPCTSKPQMWGKGSSSKQTPQEIYTARYNDKFDANRYITFKPCAIVDKCTSDSLLRAIQDCHHSYSNMWEDLLFYEYQDYELEQNQRLLLMAMTQNFIEGLTRGAASVDHANVLASYVHVPGTVDQSNSEAWHQERQFRIIGSRFMDFAKNPFKCARSLWKKEDISHLPAIRWGMEHESEALNDYQQVFGVEVQKVGLVISTIHPHFGYSADGLIGEEGILELKCPYSLKDTSYEDSRLSSPSNSFTLVDGNLFRLKRSHPYYFQVQLGLWILDRKFVDFVW